MTDDRPYSELYREAGIVWVDLESAASLLEDTKSSVMAQRQAALGDIAVNRAEQIVKASPEWVDHIEKVVKARRAANLAKINLDYVRMKFAENQSAEATRRAEIKML